MDERVGVYNPLMSDFTVDYALGNGLPQAYTVPARDIAYFSKAVAKHVKNHLADTILHKRGVTGAGGIKLSPHAVKEEILKELDV